eukprot:CAMPEP_0194331404 /NCGR_PEP_ID=MMETSP0171-20130528/55434_1 /TAXON_ID=218684 /ORGANISM="Corethron pennatum, Strain L29A3" /LENGTH=105 /DNA_ID=CAMNT_0039092853 /DNA_START=42 /DNA_END=356 /DNA_ORIENTATION=+
MADRPSPAVLSILILLRISASQEEDVADVSPSFPPSGTPEKGAAAPLPLTPSLKQSLPFHQSPLILRDGAGGVGGRTTSFVLSPIPAEDCRRSREDREEGTVAAA